MAFDRAVVREQLLRLRRELGRSGMAALALLVLAGVFHKAALEPLQARAERLAQQVARQAPKAPGQSGAAAGKLETLYAYLAREEGTTDWLAKLHAIGKATGVELQSASYKTHKAGSRLERYEIVVPLTGSYTQMRDFLKRALAEIPVLSLDQISLKRENRREGTVQAELRLTLHMVKS